MTVEYYLAAGAGIAGLAVWARRAFASFGAQRPEDYAASGPAFDIRERLNGPILCEGVIFGPTGRVSSRFVADFDARWDGDTGVMTERFRYDSGRTQDREWTLSLAGGGRIRASAADLVGAGTGRQAGSAVCLSYRIRLPADAGGHVLDVVDWMYLTPNGTIMNRSQFRKFGFKVAELVATMRPVAPVEAPEPASRCGAGAADTRPVVPPQGGRATGAGAAGEGTGAPRALAPGEGTGAGTGGGAAAGPGPAAPG